jgi:hypothetical protein
MSGLRSAGIVAGCGLECQADVLQGLLKVVALNVRPMFCRVMVASYYLSMQGCQILVYIKEVNSHLPEKIT